MNIKTLGIDIAKHVFELHGVDANGTGIEGSYEELFHHISHKNFLLELRGNRNLEHYLKLPRLQRAIGVIYRPETERQSHYLFTRLPYQFDALIHLDLSQVLNRIQVLICIAKEHICHAKRTDTPIKHLVNSRCAITSCSC